MGLAFKLGLLHGIEARREESRDGVDWECCWAGTSDGKSPILPLVGSKSKVFEYLLIQNLVRALV